MWAEQFIIILYASLLLSHTVTRSIQNTHTHVWPSSYRNTIKTHHVCPECTWISPSFDNIYVTPLMMNALLKTWWFWTCGRDTQEVSKPVRNTYILGIYKWSSSDRILIYFYNFNNFFYFERKKQKWEKR